MGRVATERKAALEKFEDLLKKRFEMPSKKWIKEFSEESSK